MRTALLARLDSATEPRDIALLAEQLSPLVHEEHDRERLRTTLLGKLAGTDDFGRVAGVIGELSATESGKAAARRALLAELHENGVGNLTEWALTTKIIDLRPDVADLDVLGDPPYGLSDEVLAAMRENSPLDAWLAALPKLSHRDNPQVPRGRDPALHTETHPPISLWCLADAVSA